MSDKSRVGEAHLFKMFCSVFDELWLRGKSFPTMTNEIPGLQFLFLGRSLQVGHAAIGMKLLHVFFLRLLEGEPCVTHITTIDLISVSMASNVYVKLRL